MAQINSSTDSGHVRSDSLRSVPLLEPLSNQLNSGDVSEHSLLEKSPKKMTMGRASFAEDARASQERIMGASIFAAPLSIKLAHVKHISFIVLMFFERNSSWLFVFCYSHVLVPTLQTTH